MAKNPAFEYAVAKRGTSMSNASFYNNDPGITVRPPTGRDTYDYFRPNEAVPTAHNQEDFRTIMRMCRSAYERVGVIRSVIDMMSEFAAEGVEIIHPDAEPNEFYKAWSKKIHLEDRAERFLNWAYKSGNVVVRRTYGTISGADVRKLRKDMTNYKTEVKTAGIRLPLSYIFYDPSTIELVGGSAGAISSKKIYAIRIPYQFLDGIRTPKNALEKQVYDAMPQEIKDALAGKSTDGLLLVPIKDENLYVGHYKKDDSDIWAKSFIYSILDDILYNDKLKLAKVSALDGFYNVIRLWRLGDHKENLHADPTATARLLSILEANTGGGAADIIWSSDIALEEFYPPIEKLVNFEENMHNILLGLGVPEGLVGGKAENSSGMTTNYLGLKNLIKRLEAGRRMIREWLESEIDIIQKEMGFKKRPIVRFAHADLYDDQVYFNLLTQLVDRNIVSDETILERVNEHVTIERGRVSKESKLRENGELPPKASPYHKPDLVEQQDHEIKKIKEQGKVDAENTPNDTENSRNLQRKVSKTPRSKGRPSGSRDTVTRKRGPAKLRKVSSAGLLLEAARIYAEVDKFIKASALESYTVSSIRQLTTEQDKEIDKLRLTLFANIEPYTDLNDEALVATCLDPQGPSDLFSSHYQEALAEAGQENLSLEQKSLIRIQAYANTWLDVYNEYNEDI